jgi:hypothetical protein
MRAVLLMLAGVSLFAQSQILSPDAEFDLNAGHKAQHGGRAVRCYFAATPSELTFVSIGENAVMFDSADLAGRILYSTSRLASVHAQIYAALPRSDGSVWLVSAGPHKWVDGPAVGDMGGAPFARPDSFNELDLYSRSGRHLEALRLLSPAGGSASPIAADNDQLVLRSAASARFGPPQSQFIRFGKAVNGEFKERTAVRLEPAILGAIPILAENGSLLLIGKTSGTMEVIDPQTRRGSIVRLAKPERVRAVAQEAGYLYLLSSDAVMKTDLAGQVLSTYRFQFVRGFEPVCLGVTGRWLYLVDKFGHGQRFTIASAPASAADTTASNSVSPNRK